MNSPHTPAAKLACHQIMRRPVDTVQDEDSVLDAARTMRERGVGFLPVCDREGVVIGVLTDRDVALRVAAEDHPASRIPVGSAMTGKVVSCTTEDAVAKAERLMRTHRITRVVVLDRAGRAAGVLSLSDIAAYGTAAELARTLRAVAERKYEPARP